MSPPMMQESHESQETHDVDGVKCLPQQPKKKKPKRRSAKKKRLGTGFEEYFADAPTTPAEALLEQRELYSRRIQSCIHRYRTRRRLNSELTLYFNEYMFLGGIDTAQASFNDNDLEDTALIPQLAPSTATDSDGDAAAAASSPSPPSRFFDAAAVAQDPASSRFYDGNARNWTVDFAGVAAGFLSVSVLPLTDLEAQPLEAAIGVVENFLRYVLQHDVCPEYGDDVNEALRICRRARDEWPRLCRFKTLLPGAFNLAAAQNFDVHENGDWSLLSHQDQQQPRREMSPKLVFYASLVASGEPVPGTADEIRLVRQSVRSLELVAVEMPSAQVADSFRRLALDSDDTASPTMLGLQPLGRAVFRPAPPIQDGWVHQTPPPDARDDGHDSDGDIFFFFEEPILAEMTVGMKVRARVGELSNGLHFVKSFEDVQPSFYVFVPQYLIKDYKLPRINDRPPPSVHDQSAERDRAGGVDDDDQE